MPIPGQPWGLINRSEKDIVGSRDFDIRETSFIDTVKASSEEVFEPSVNVNDTFYAMIVKREIPTCIKDSSTPSLSRFRCLVFDGPDSHIPFNLESLGKKAKGKKINLDDYTMNMFDVFTCENKSVDNDLARAKPGTIVKITYGHYTNLSDPIIVSTTHFPPLIPVESKRTLNQFKNNVATALKVDDYKSDPSQTDTDIKEEQRQLSLATTGGKSQELKWPLPGHHPGSRFGPRISPKSGKRVFHKGIDIGAKRGEPIYAADDGIVIVSATTAYGGYGGTIVIRHKKGDLTYYTLYAHQSQLVAKRRKSVKKGDLIGYVGTTGSSTDPHLHFELRMGRNGRRNAIDPLPHIKDFV